MQWENAMAFVWTNRMLANTRTGPIFPRAATSSPTQPGHGLRLRVSVQKTKRRWLKLKTEKKIMPLFKRFPRTLLLSKTVPLDWPD